MQAKTPAFEQAMNAHRHGDLASAERLYRVALASDPRHAGAYHHLGLLCHQAGRPAEAVAQLRRAAVLAPGDAGVIVNLGIACKAAGDFAAAVTCLVRATQLAPAMPAAHFNLGLAWMAAGKAAEAVESFEAVIRLQPQDAAALANLASARLALGLHAEAVVAARRAIATAPGQARFHTLLGHALQGAGHGVPAAEAFLRAITLDPASVEARLGAGTTLCAIERYAQAIEQLGLATQHDAQCSPAWFNLGIAHLALGHYVQAEAAFQRVLALRPGWPVAHFHRAMNWLSAGDFARGLPEYEWRLKLDAYAGEPQWPRWSGAPLDGCLVVDAEQGLGDTLHFLRFVPLASDRVGKVVLRVQSALLRLLKPLASQWGVSIVALDDAPPEAQAWCPLMSLPLMLGTSMDSIPDMPAPLPVPEASREMWRARLSGLKRRRVGIAWSGRIRANENRAIPLHLLAPLFARDDIDWIVLQRDIPADDAQHLAMYAGTGRPHDFRHHIEDMADTAAIIGTLDAVVSIDTAIAHLAGAMGKPLWLMLAVAADWRWRQDTTHSRWYPSARLVRQTTPGDWLPVIAAVNEALNVVLAG
ncbi:tetratricopeptide repeat protein [Cupriavidus metallidurans]|uniref:tetratricopeptide repeat protein n=1 Tax=Cupriavidus metallidurans TaxID=119219 RepID=UPI001647DBED|nr:tetratricopeptide repeat protein [Cupriavidus metallidurans]